MLTKHKGNATLVIQQHAKLRRRDDRAMEVGIAIDDGKYDTTRSGRRRLGTLRKSIRMETLLRIFSASLHLPLSIIVSLASRLHQADLKNFSNGAHSY